MMDTEGKADLLSALGDLPSLPAVALELLRALDDDRMDTKAVARKIGYDPVLSARVLRIVNSPFYGVPGQISNLTEAVMVLGFSAVRNLALAASVSAAFPPGKAGEDQVRALWRHSFCCALCAEALAPSAKTGTGAAFSAGLLHDIGCIALLVTHPGGPAIALEQFSAERGDFGKARQMSDPDHAALGARLLEAWRLPAALVRAVRHHHQPDVEPTAALTDLINVADLLAHVVEARTLDSWIPTNQKNSAMVRLRLTGFRCGQLLGGVANDLEALVSILN